MLALISNARAIVSVYHTPSDVHGVSFVYSATSRFGPDSIKYFGTNQEHISIDAELQNVRDDDGLRAHQLAK